MNSPTDLYSILGVSPAASPEDIKSAFRMAARRFHPDVNSHTGAVSQFREIAAAYETLSDSVERATYDSHRRERQNAKSYFSMRITPSKRVLPMLEEPQVVYLLVELLPERVATKDRLQSNMNLTLVLDRSTSMSGLRLERTRTAAFQIVDSLSEQDVLSVVMFSDKAEVLVPATPVTNRSALKAQIASIHPSGATEIYNGLEAGLKENRRFATKNTINHVILLTDGRTYGDEERCMELAANAVEHGIGISAMGLGEEWNDKFLDKLASTTGGTSEYINSANAVVRFMNDRVRALGRSLAERVTLSVAPDPDIKIESIFRISPSAQPLSLETDPIPVGQLQIGRTIGVILQAQIPANQRIGFRTLVRFAVSSDILRDNMQNYRMVGDTSVEISNTPPVEEPPLVILDALGKLTLYRMQQKAEEALARGDVREATARLEILATRLLAAGEVDLAQAAQQEARHVSNTNMLSEEGRKTLKYGTRVLVTPKTDAGQNDETGDASVTLPKPPNSAKAK